MSVKKKLLIAVVGLAIATGGLMLLLRLPAYSGTLLPLSVAQQELAGRLRGHVVKLADEIGPRSLTTTPGPLWKATAYITEQLIKGGYTPTFQTFSVSGYYKDGLFGSSHATQSTHNVIAELPGVPGESEIIVVGAHYDGVDKCPAANDNGSGVAALIEIARTLKQEQLNRTVRFVAFTNEESPFFRSDDMGSYRYAKACKDRGDKIAAMISLETIGYYRDKPNSQHFPVAALSLLYPTTGNFLCFVGSLNSRDLLSSCAKTFIDASKFPTQALSAPPEMKGVDFSDHLSFWRCGYPAIMVTDTAPYRYPHYHTAQDTSDKIDYDKLARVTDGMSAVVRELANK
jgi:hypothetical protein